MKDLLQALYDSANFYGYAERKGKRYYPYTLRQIANRLGVELEYNCPA